MQTHFRAYSVKRLCQEMRGAHPCLEGAEWMLHRSGIGPLTVTALAATATDIKGERRAGTSKVMGQQIKQVASGSVRS